MSPNENPRTNLLRILAVLSVLWLAGCGSKTLPPATRTPIPTPTFAEQIEQARQKWESQGITNYRIEFEFYENFANGLRTQREVTVKDGQVFDSSCLSDECPAFVLANVFTVYDLFPVAQISVLDLGEPDECIRHLSFDPVYGFPDFISINCPTSVDEEHSIQVISFEVID